MKSHCDTDILYSGVFVEIRRFCATKRATGHLCKEPDVVGRKRGLYLSKGGVDSGRAAADDTRNCQTGDRAKRTGLK